MKQLSLYAFILFATAIQFDGCSRDAVKRVVAVKKTGTYHREECPPVNMAKAEVMTVGEAKRENLKPCKVCKPDQD